MKVWELLAKLEGVDPDAEVVANDGQLTLFVRDVFIEAPAERARRIVLVLDD